MSRKDQIKAIIAREVRAVFGDRQLRVFIFGSQAGLPELIPADIDLGLDAGSPISFADRTRLSTALNESDEMLYEFDVVDFRSVNKEFIDVASQRIEPILI